MRGALVTLDAMTERDRPDEPAGGADEHWNPYRIPEFGGSDEYAALGRGDGPAEPTAADYYDDQYVAGGWSADHGDHDPFAAGAGFGDDWAAAESEPHPEPAQEPEPEPAPAASPAPERGANRAPLAIGIAIGALAVAGAFVAGAMLVPRFTAPTPPSDASAPTEAADSGAPAEPVESADSADRTDPAGPGGDDGAAAPAAVDVTGVWDGSTGSPAVEFVVTLDDDGTTVTGTVEYTTFPCTSSVRQTARDGATVTMTEEVTSGNCTAAGTPIVYLLDPAQPDRIEFEIGARTGVLTRR